MGTFKLRVLEGHKACTIVQSEVLEWTKCYLWSRSFALDHVLIQFQEVCPWLAVRMKVSTQQTTSLTVVTISVLLLYFSQVSLLIGYQWRNKYNLDSHFETSTGKNKLRGKSTAVSKAWDCETSELTQIIAISALSQSWWALQYTVLLQTSLFFFRRHRDRQSGQLVHGCSCSVIYFIPFCSFSWCSFTSAIKGKRLLLGRSSLCQSVTAWSQLWRIKCQCVWAMWYVQLLHVNSSRISKKRWYHDLRGLSEMVIPKILEEEPRYSVWSKVS